MNRKSPETPFLHVFFWGALSCEISRKPGPPAGPLLRDISREKELHCTAFKNDFVSRLS